MENDGLDTGKTTAARHSTSPSASGDFAGGIRDPATGLIRFGYRDYDPANERWVSRDPILFQSGQANLYQYVQNNPINLTDPMGLSGEECCKKDWFDCFSTCVGRERFDQNAVLGTLFGTLAFGTMQKTAAEKKMLGPRGRFNPITSQTSRWAGRLSNPKSTRAVRNFGRSMVGRGLGVLATGALVFEGFYDLGAIARCSAVCEDDSCTY